MLGTPKTLTLSREGRYREREKTEFEMDGFGFAKWIGIKGERNPMQVD